MKKLFVIITSLICIFNLMAATTLASETSQKYDSTIQSEGIIEYFEDGSYSITTFHEEITINSIVPNALMSTKSGSKTTTKYSSSGSAIYAFTLSGSFSYNGSIATATSASYSYTIYDSSWSFSNGYAGVTGATAYGYGTFSHNGAKQTSDLSITCSASGTLS